MRDRYVLYPFDIGGIVDVAEHVDVRGRSGPLLLEYGHALPISLSTNA